MSDKYIPDYATNHICIKFKDEFDDDFAKKYLRTYGFELYKEQSSKYNWLYLNAPANNIETLKELFYKKPHNKFIDWIELRDKKWERRQENLEKVILELQGIQDEGNTPQEEFKDLMNHWSNYLKKISND